jgi:flagellar P-ring protein precursor FlgI
VELTDITGQVVFATASGPLTVGGFSAEGAGASAKKNHVTVGVLPSGGKVERLVPTQVVSEHGFIYLDAKVGQDTLGNMVRAGEAINAMYPGVATILPDGKTIRVAVPADLPETAHIAYIDYILRQEVETDNLSRVIINERSGVIVMGGDVRLRPGAVALGGLTVTIAETQQASQPGPLSAGSTEVLDRTDLNVEERDAALVAIPAAVTLQEVVEVLNVLGASPRDLISILTAMSEGGLLVAEIHRM